MGWNRLLQQLLDQSYKLLEEACKPGESDNQGDPERVERTQTKRVLVQDEELGRNVNPICYVLNKILLLILSIGVLELYLLLGHVLPNFSVIVRE